MVELAVTIAAGLFLIWFGLFALAIVAAILKTICEPIAYFLGDIVEAMIWCVCALGRGVSFLMRKMWHARQAPPHATNLD